MLLLTLELPGAPRGKGRPRFRVIGHGKKQFVSTYTDAETRKYEERLKAVGTTRMGMGDPFDCPLAVKVEALTPIPGSWSLKKQALAAAGEIAPGSNPDADNICKIALDSLNKVVWRDDSLIVSLLIVKRYSLTPLLRIGVWKWFD
jgi:Holliday junction resolvase RusA-like endonuclease